jgi:hypothetical protein
VWTYLRAVVDFGYFERETVQFPLKKSDADIAGKVT